MSWVESEFENVDFGDYRLDCRCLTILDTLGTAPGNSIPKTFDSWSEIKATYNFFSNELVTEEKLLKPHFDKTVERIQDHQVVLLPSDTSMLDYTSKESMEGRGRLTNKQQGLWLHTTLALTPEHVNLGILEVNFWKREDDVNAKKNLDNLPIEEKESYRWLKSYRLACEVAQDCPKTQIIYMADREGDITEVFDEASSRRDISADYIIRSKHDRLIKEGETYQIPNKLRKALKKAPTLGEVNFLIPATKNRKAREVKQSLKAVKVRLNSKRKNKAKVLINAVMAIEENPPQEEKALVWIFITSLPVNNFEDVSKVISYYLVRWEIELFFKILKSGCKIKERQLSSTDRMKPLITLFMILSWRVQFVTMMGRNFPSISCTEIFEASEWKSVFKIVNRNKHVPRKAPKLGDFIEMIGRLGGHIKRKSGKPPGIKAMWEGMARMADFAIAWEAFRK